MVAPIVGAIEQSNFKLLYMIALPVGNTMTISVSATIASFDVMVAPGEGINLIYKH